MENPASLSLSCISCRFTVKHRDVDLKMPSWYSHAFAARFYHMLVVDVDTDWECQGLSVIWHWHFPKIAGALLQRGPSTLSAIISKRNRHQAETPFVAPKTDRERRVIAIRKRSRLTVDILLSLADCTKDKFGNQNEIPSQIWILA